MRNDYSGGRQADTWETTEMPDLARPDWQKRAACRGMDPNIFFPEKGRNTLKGELGIKAICGPCPVREDCLEFGVRQHYGVWGGLTDKQRRPYRQKYKNSPRVAPNGALGFLARPKAACGTEAGYVKHMRAKMAPCEACRDAHRVYRNPEQRKTSGNKGVGFASDFRRGLAEDGRGEEAG